MSPYPSHIESSLDSILDSTGCLPEIKYKTHNFLFKCPLVLTRTSPGDYGDRKNLTGFL